MKSIFRGGVLRAHTTRRECLLLATLGLLAVTLAASFPAQQDSKLSWRERDFRVHFHAQQLFGRDAEELNEQELNDVLRWKRLIELTADYEPRGGDHLSDEDCRFVIEVLDDLCPHLEKHHGYLRIYRSCSARLADAPAN
jgi:hypothetical protein